MPAAVQKSPATGAMFSSTCDIQVRQEVSTAFSGVNRHGRQPRTWREPCTSTVSGSVHLAVLPLSGAQRPPRPTAGKLAPMEGASCPRVMTM